jgi:aspartyl-tRNA(Asn)/glutamyl-tRNA(Gln) amidotransferase subunit A
MPDLRTITEIAPLVRAGAISPVTLVTDCLAAIEARPEVNAFITLLRDSALEDASRAEADIRAGRYRGPLHGIPIAVKDLIHIAGARTTSGSALPSTEASSDAPVIQRLREAGAVLIGKTNLHEFAFGTTSEESAYGPVRNPLDETRTAGGSSGGSAAALAAGMAFGAIGTDTGGSVRIPSAACGTVGLKPAIGEISTDGVVPLSATLDHVGPMARSVADVGLMRAALTDAPADPPWETTGSLVFGIPRPYFCELLDRDTGDALASAADALAAAGHQLVDVEIDHAAWTPHVYLHIVLPEAAWYHAPSLDRHPSAYSPGIRVRLEMGRYVLAEDYVRAMRLRELLRQHVDRALERCSVLMLPTLPMGAPPLGATTVDFGDRREPVRAAMLRLTQLFNITGHPALAMPAGVGHDNLPRSIQLVCSRTSQLLSIARDVESCIAGGAGSPYISGGAGSVGGGTG